MANFDRGAALRRIASSRASVGGNFIKPGRYLFEVVNLILDGKRSGDCFIAELGVVEAYATEPDPAQPGSFVQPNKVGSVAGYVQVLSKHDSAAGNAKAFCLSLLNAAEQDTSEEDFYKALDALTLPNQIARGMLIGDETFTKPIRSKPGQLFTAHRWQHVAIAESIRAERRALIEANKIGTPFDVARNAAALAAEAAAAAAQGQRAA